MFTRLVIFSIFSLPAWSLSPGYQKCVTNVLLNSGHTPHSLEFKRITQGQSALDKEFRGKLINASPAVYDKHIKAKSIPEAVKLSSTGKEAAQYLPGLNRIKIEKDALLNRVGIYKNFVEGGKQSTIYKFVKFDDVVGFDQGKSTQWIRVEYSSGTFHGHPIELSRLKIQCPECLK